MPSSPSCICTGAREDATVPLHDISEAIVVDDIDRAIEAGLLRWNGCAACTIADGLSPVDTERLLAVRESLLGSLAARERHRARQQRLQQRNSQREARRDGPGTTSPQPSALPSAAAAALARAKTKAAARAKQ